MSEATAIALREAARDIIARAEHEQRDLSEFEAGRVDALLDVAEAMHALMCHQAHAEAQI